MPLEGGLYQWAKLGFNELTGFLVAWNLWLFAILSGAALHPGCAGERSVCRQHAPAHGRRLGRAAAGVVHAAEFAIPIVGTRSLRPPIWLTLAAISGFVTTLAFVVLSILPIVPVESRLAFAVKISAVVLLASAIGAATFAGRNRRA